MTNSREDNHSGPHTEGLPDTGQSLKDMGTPTCRELGEKLLLMHDVAHSRKAMTLWFDRYCETKEATEESAIIGHALFRDAIIQFVGCFEGKDGLTTQEVFANVEGGIEYFQWLKDIRDSYAAHKFGPMRQCAVGVALDKTGTEVIGSGHLMQTYHGPGKGAEQDMLRVMRITGKYLLARIDDLTKTLLEEARSLSHNQLLALPNVQTYAPDEIRVGRDTFQKRMRSRHTDNRRS